MNNRKRKVADIALKLFVEKGIQQTSIQEIIDKANISKGTFYNYFSSKIDCVADILEFLRYDASQQRAAMQIGKDPKDRAVLIEQITILMHLNQERNLQPLFESILSSNEKELKKLVMHHRIYELEWLSNRFIDVLGDEIRDYAFEATILFYGMQQHLLFTMKVTNSSYSLQQVVDVVLSYIELIIPAMMERGSALLNHSAIHMLSSKIDRHEFTLEEVKEAAQELQQNFPFDQEQQDLLDAILNELQRERIRKIVVQPLLKPFKQSFAGKPNEQEVNTFTNMVWYYLKIK